MSSATKWINASSCWLKKQYVIVLCGTSWGCFKKKDLKKRRKFQVLLKYRLGSRGVWSIFRVAGGWAARSGCIYLSECCFSRRWLFFFFRWSSSWSVLRACDVSGSPRARNYGKRDLFFSCLTFEFGLTASRVVPSILRLFRLKSKVEIFREFEDVKDEFKLL